MPSVKVVDAKGNDTGAVELKADVFGVEIRVPLLHQANQLAEEVRALPAAPCDALHVQRLDVVCLDEREHP